MTHALITGGAGFIGSHLAEYLLAQDYTVTVIDNLSTGDYENVLPLQGDSRFRFVQEDLRNILVTDRLVSECDVIFHLAAAVGVQKILQEPIASIENNIGGTEVMLQAARRYRKKILIASTSEVYGKGTRIPFSEEDDTRLGATAKMRWSYAFSKAIDEFLGLAYYQETGLPVVVFRLFNTVGPRQSGQYGMVLPRFVQWALAGEPLQVYGSGDQTRCFCNVSDVVQALHKLSLEEAAVGQVFNVGSNEEISIQGLAEMVIQRTESASSVQIVPYEEAYTEPGYEDFMRRVPSVAKIGNMVGWEPAISLPETIDQIIAYYREKNAHG